jgi:hypothetical protein
MVTIHPQFVIDENQRRQAVILPVAEWERVVEELEELDDMRAYDEAKADAGDAVAFDKAVREIEEGSDA